MFSSSLKDFYSKLQDDTSRRIFMHRLSYSITGDQSHINKLVNETLDFWGSDIHDFIDSYTPDKRVVLYGTGSYSVFILQYLSNIGIPVACFCDSNPEKWRFSHCGLPTISPDNLNRKNDLIFISTSTYQDEIYESLSKLNFNQVFRMFKSGKAYYLFPYNVPLLNANGVYIDAGCFDGKTIEDFVKFTGGSYKKIYGFEPDPVSFQRTQKFVFDNGIKNTFILQNGLWSSNRELFFNNTGATLSAVSSNGIMSINCVTIDSVAKDDIVTFIKMDIEGSELEAIKGATNTIRKNKPDLAISIYHKPEDILEIPLLIQELVPEYRFFIRHYTIGADDTVLYAMTNLKR